MPRGYRQYKYLGLAADAAPASAIASLVSDLLGMQGEVQQYAPALSSQWGWLAAQGQALVHGGTASVTADQWAAQYRSFWAALQNALPSQDVQVDDAFVSNLTTDAEFGFPQGISTDVDTYGAAASNAAAAVGNSPLNPANWNLGAYLPWIVGAIVVALVLPAVIEAVKE